MQIRLAYQRKAPYSQLNVTVEKKRKNILTSEWISQCISSMNNAQATAKESVQDIPQADEYIKIDINTEDAKSTLFV